MEQNQEGVVQMQPAGASPADIMAQAFAEDENSTNSAVNENENEGIVEENNAQEENSVNETTTEENELEVIDTTSVQNKKNTSDQAFANMRKQMNLYKQQAFQNQQ